MGLFACLPGRCRGAAWYWLLGLFLCWVSSGLLACENRQPKGAVKPLAECGRAALPRKVVNIAVVSPGNVIKVGAGGDFQLALERAELGDVIELEAGAIFRGPYTLPKKHRRQHASRQWISIRSSKANTALPPGVRVSPGDLPAMAVLESRGGAVISTAPGAHHFRLVGLAFRPAGSLSQEGKTLNSLINFGVAGRRSDELPHHLIIERCLLLGDPALGTRRGVILNSAESAVVDSYFSNFKVAGEDAQAIIAWAGPGPYRIQNNYLEAAGENLMFGGADPDIPGLVPADIEVRGNHIAKPLAWRGNSPWTVKNLLELKNARRVLIDGNLFEHNWSQSQNGFSILFTVRNQDGGAPWSVVEDVTFSNNIVRRVARGVNVLGYDDSHRSRQSRRISLRNNLFADLGGAWGAGDFLQILDGTDAVIVEHNTVLNDGNVLFSEGRPHWGFRFINNIVLHRKYGMAGTDSALGMAVLARYFPDATVSGNWIVAGPPELYPDGNDFPSSIDVVGFNHPAAGDYRIAASSASTPGVNFSELCAALSTTERPFYCTSAKGEGR